MRFPVVIPLISEATNLIAFCRFDKTHARNAYPFIWQLDFSEWDAQSAAARRSRARVPGKRTEGLKSRMRVLRRTPRWGV
jgi:hypothetical protein